jgi:PAS domain S-box-containing protein
MITIRQNTAWGLRGASGILLLCIIHASFAVADEPRPTKVALVEGTDTRFPHQTTKAGLRGDRQGRVGSPPLRFENVQATGDHALGRDLKFTHLTTNDGLSQNRIYSILQDRRGFMWFATEDGLNRYDGNTFVVYQNNPDDPNTLSASLIQSLIEDGQGYLWIGTWGGLNKFDPTSERFTHYRYNPDNPNSISGDVVRSIAQDSRGYLWIGTVDDGLNKLDPATETFTRYRNDSNGQFVGTVNSIIEDSHRDIWFVGTRGLFHLSPQTEQITRLPVPTDRFAADYIHQDKAGNLWMLVYSPVARLVKYDRQAERFTEYPFEEGAVGIPNSTILDDGQNGLWVASSQGLYHFDLQTEQFTYRSQHDETNPDSLNDNSVTSIYRDRAGALWLGTETGGLNILDSRQGQFGSYRHRPGKPGSLSPGLVSAMHQDRNGILWAGFTRFALDRLDRKTGQITHYLPGSGHKNGLGKGSSLRDNIYRDAQGYLWFGGWDSGLDRFDERSGQFKHYRHKPGDPNSLLSDNILCVYQDRSGKLWVGQVDGLSRFDPETEKFDNYRNDPAKPASLGIGNVSAIYQDRSGTLWFGTWMGTLSRFDDKTNTFVNLRADSSDPHKLSGGRIHAIHEDQAGTLWLGTTDGLYRYNRENETFTHYTVNQGLPSSEIQCILGDRSGRLWLGTKKGISRFDPQTGRFRNYDTSDGLQSNDFSEGCYEDSQSGEMLFGGNNGITTFFPENIRDNPFVPPVVLTSFKIFNKPVPIGPKSVLKKAIPYADSLTLSYRDNIFSFEFAALSYANSQKNRYRYKLESLETGWNEVGSKQRLATYTNLSPGKYIFRVQGSNSDGVWNEEGVSLSILITPPWWKTTGFRALCLAAFLALLWAAYQLRVRQIEEQEKKFREAVETMPALAFIARPDGYRTFVNRRWVEYTGMTVEQATGSGWEAAVHPDDLLKIIEMRRRLAARGEPVEYETRLRRGADGQYRWFQTRLAPLRDKRGKLVKWCGVANDIEDRKRAEQLQADLAHTNRVSLLGELAASIAHDVNQPLSGIVSNGSACLHFLGRDTPDVEEAREAARDIVRDGKRAGEIITRLRSLYKKAPPQRTLVDVNDTIREMIVMLRGEANRFGVSMRTDLATGLPKVTADRVQLQQVLMNLMLNAIEAMKETGGVLTVKSQRDQDGRVLVSVSDTGVGLPAEKADQIFNAFFTTKPQGSGMGLAISRSIVESHGGRLWATPNDGRGASFHFTLPKYHDEESKAGV